jgi:hypothetical protein
MSKPRIAASAFATIVAVIVGGMVTSCDKQNTASAQPTTATVAPVASSTATVAPVASSTAAGSPTPPPTANPAPGVPVTAADGSFTVTLPTTLNVDPANPNKNESDSLISALGKGGNSMFSASVTPAEQRGNTCQESLAKTSTGLAKKFQATVDPGGPTEATVDGETGYRQSLTLNSDNGRGFALLCVRHHGVEDTVFYAAPTDSIGADLDAIIGSWKWAA